MGPCDMGKTDGNGPYQDIHIMGHGGTITPLRVVEVQLTENVRAANVCQKERYIVLHSIFFFPNASIIRA